MARQGEPFSISAKKDESNGSIESLVERFVGVFPSGVFTLVEIQGFLIGYKNYPQLAIQKVPEWLNEKRLIPLRQLSYWNSPFFVLTSISSIFIFYFSYFFLILLEIFFIVWPLKPNANHSPRFTSVLYIHLI